MFKKGDKFKCTCGARGCNPDLIHTVDKIIQYDTITTTEGFAFYQSEIVPESVFNSPLYKLLGEDDDNN